MPKAYAYSTDPGHAERAWRYWECELTTEGITRRRAACPARPGSCWECKLPPEGIDWGGFFLDTADLAHVPFAKRNAAGKLCKIVQRGDHIIICTAKSLCLSVGDFYAQLAEWYRAGVLVHVQDLGLVPTNEVCRAILELLVEIYESLQVEPDLEAALEQSLLPSVLH